MGLLPLDRAGPARRSGRPQPLLATAAADRLAPDPRSGRLAVVREDGALGTTEPHRNRDLRVDVLLGAPLVVAVGEPGSHGDAMRPWIVLWLLAGVAATAQESRTPPLGPITIVSPDRALIATVAGNGQPGAATWRYRLDRHVDNQKIELLGWSPLGIVRD